MRDPYLLQEVDGLAQGMSPYTGNFFIFFVVVVVFEKLFGGLCYPQGCVTL